MQLDKAIETLMLHRELLANAKGFEEYRKAHIAYVDVLLNFYRAEKLEQAALEHWLRTTEEIGKE